MDFIFDPSLVLYLPLYGLDGASFMSRDAYGRVCTVSGASWNPNGYYFDGTDDFINIGNANLVLGSTPRTALAWIKALDISTEQAILQYGHSATRQLFRLYIQSELLRLATYSDDHSSDASKIASNVWLLVGVTYDGSTGLTFYVNENKAGSGTLGGLLNTALGYYEESIGGGGTDGTAISFGGFIGSVFLYNRALTPQEIQHNYLTTKWRYQ